MYDVLDISRYIINYSNKHNYDISNLKLQKLLYFVQAYFLLTSKGKNLCFNNVIQAWDFGPVVPKAYHSFKRYGNLDIPPVIRYFEKNKDGSLSKHIFDEHCISKSDRRKIDDVIEQFKDYTASEMVELTHLQDPWKDAFVSHENNPIEPEAIARYFNE